MTAEKFNTLPECECTEAPMGRGGLEGFMEKETYKYEIREDGKGKYVRVYHDKDYYETCGTGTFQQHFKSLVRK